MTPSEKTLWLAERRKGISGTDTPAILGVSPWKTRGEVWLDKKGLLAAKEESDPMLWGTLLEPVIADRYAYVMGKELLKCSLIQHPKYPWLIGNPDRLIKGEELGLEIKNVSAYKASHWGDTGSDLVPEDYLWQCYHYMALTGYREWHLAVLIGGNDFRIFVIKLNDETITDYLIAETKKFWEEYVLKSVEPPPDEGISEYIKRLYAVASKKAATINIQSEEDKALLLRLQLARESFKEIEAEKEASENSVKMLMKDSQYLQCEQLGIQISWKNNKASDVVNWEKLAMDRMKDLDPITKSVMIKQFTEQKTGARVFRFTE